MTEHNTPDARPLSLRAVTRLAVGSANPVKIAAVRAVVHRVAPHVECVGLSVPSGVPDQPWGDEETIQGAETRARGALAATAAELAIGLEGGVVRESDGAVRSCAWAVAVGADGRRGIGGSLAMPLPREIARALEAGAELGDAIDAMARIVGSKHGAGAVGVLTAGLVDRQLAYEHLVTYALAPWLAPEYFPELAPG